MRVISNRPGERVIIEWRDHCRNRRRWAAFENKRASEEFGHKLEAVAACVATGIVLDREQIEWLRALPDTMRRKLHDIGLIDARIAMPGGTLRHNLVSYINHLRTNDRAPNYIAAAESSINATLNALNAQRLGDIKAHKVSEYLANLSKGYPSRPVSRSTRNRHLTYLKSFLNWMVDNELAEYNPIQRLKRLNESIDPAHPREPLSPSEFETLLNSVEENADRYWLYRFAAETGLRVGQIRSLKVANFTFGDSPRFEVQATYARKSKRSHILPLRRDTARQLAVYFAPKSPTGVAFKVPYEPHKAIKKDYERAGIPYQSAAGKYRDFHALRAYFATSMADKCDLFTLQRLMQHHSGPEITRRYVRTGEDEMRRAIESVQARGLASQPCCQISAKRATAKQSPTGTSSARKRQRRRLLFSRVSRAANCTMGQG